MLKAERHRQIMESIQQDHLVTLEGLHTLLGVSESTIRRDLDELEAKGLVRRVHGGAQAVHGFQNELSNVEKLAMNRDAKELIATRALSFIEPGMTIYIDAGTTTQFLVELLTHQDIRVVTNSIHHASILMQKKIPTYIIGGYIKANTDAIIGPTAVHQLGQYHFDAAFMGMNGVGVRDFSTTDEEEAQVKKQAIESAKSVFLLVDQSKIGRHSFVKVGLTKDLVLITDLQSGSSLEKLKKKVKVIGV